MAGVTVSFSVEPSGTLSARERYLRTSEDDFSLPPGGTLNPSSATTGSNGQAETRLTLGNPGSKGAGALPVEFSSFRAVLKDKCVVLNWATESELDYVSVQGKLVTSWGNLKNRE